jgi:opacity protein-like surface antigen
MNKYTTSIAALVFATAANAADLPSKSSPSAPTVSTSESTDFYVGGSIGSKAAWNQNPWYGSLRANVRAGWEVNEFARVEADYDYAWNEDSRLRSHTVTTNAIGQYKIGFVPVVPYALAGVGYRWAEVKNEPVYVAGAGLRYDITSNIEADARYRYITDRKRVRDENVLTLGVNYKF